MQEPGRTTAEGSRAASRAMVELGDAPSDSSEASETVGDPAPAKPDVRGGTGDEAGNALRLGKAQAAPEIALAPHVSTPFKLHDSYPKPSMDDVTYSMLSAYRACPRKFFLGYVQPVPREERWPQGPLIAGRCLHEIIEVSERDEIWARPDGLDILVLLFRLWFDEQVRAASRATGMEVRWGGKGVAVRDETGAKVVDPKAPRGAALKSKEDYQWWMNFGGRVMLRRYIEVRVADTKAGRLLVEGGAEKIVRVPIEVMGKTKYLRVIIDAFLMMDAETGEVVVRDYKTGQIGRADETQLYIYMYAIIMAELGLPRLEFVYLRAEDERKRVKLIEADRTLIMQEVPLWFAWLQAMRKASDEGGGYPTAPEAWRCKSCEFKHLCPMGAQYLEED